MNVNACVAVQDLIMQSVILKKLFKNNFFLTFSKFWLFFSVLCDRNSQLWFTKSELQVMLRNSELDFMTCKFIYLSLFFIYITWEFMSQVCKKNCEEKKSELQDINSQLRESQNCEKFRIVQYKLYKKSHWLLTLYPAILILNLAIVRKKVRIVR